MPRTSRSRDTPPAEVAAAVAGALLLAAVLGVLLTRALTQRGGPPDVRVRIVDISRAGDRFHVDFVAENVGTATAAGVLVRGELIDGGRVVAQAETTLEYIPAESRARGGLFFDEDPRARRLRVRALGYRTP